MNKINLISSLILLITLSVFGQDTKKDSVWNVSNPQGNWDFKDINYLPTRYMDEY